MVRRIAAAALALGLVAAPAAAEAPPAEGGMTKEEIAQFQAFAAGAPYRNALFAAAKRQNDSLPTSCPEATFRLENNVVFMQAAHFDANGNPTVGAWVLRLDTEGCPHSVRLNLLTMVQPGQGARLLSLLPGSTRAEPALQRDALPFAGNGTVALRPKDCTAIRVIDTEFNGFEGTPLANAKPGRDPRPWKETWTVVACEVRIAVVIRFIPDATGTTISVKANEATLK